jgi:glycosyltransferase involved in cell wall biosynthesis
VVQHALNKNFADHKNYGSKRCVGDYIVQCDADEYLYPVLLNNMHELIESNPTVELYRVPRVNIVRGATDDDARNWGWHMMRLPEFGDLPIINWGNGGDYQSRIYKNSLKIQWQKSLHETIVGASIVAHLPKDVEWSIIHDKTIDRQRAQNEFYNKNWSIKANMGQG